MDSDNLSMWYILTSNCSHIKSPQSQQRMSILTSETKWFVQAGVAEALLQNQRFMARVDAVHGAMGKHPGTSGIGPKFLDLTMNNGGFHGIWGYFMDFMEFHGIFQDSMGV